MITPVDRSKSTTSMPKSREVASGVVNLGNTCYMNAVLQALAHAPELCLAIECESHLKSCPIAKVNAERKMLEKEKAETDSVTNDKATVKEERSVNNENKEDSPDDKIPTAVIQASAMPAIASKSKGKNSRSKGKKLKGKSPPRSNTPDNMIPKNDPDANNEFCLLCEIEKHLSRVHSSGKLDVSPSASPTNPTEFSNSSQAVSVGSSSEAVAPFTFVNGFITHVAPWFKLGVQEDSHEFLRLLIDAMQKSCIKARKRNLHNKQLNIEKNGVKTGDNTDSSIKLREEKSASNGSEKKKKKDSNKKMNEEEGNEYAFKLFRGTVESIVKCSSCRALSTTVDPIEDIGLEVTSVQNSGVGHGSSSPVPVSLNDVTTSLEKFTATEKLDSGYVCEKCGKIGRATKQSRLASIPPILTLHLKRFRYGSGDNVGGCVGQSLMSGGTSSRRRGGNAELFSLLGSGADSGGFGGTSGSAKIEGHIKFEQVFDIRPYLTKDKQKEVRSMFCRLFAVIVHAGKNSHSGHYIAYVRNVAKNEWWKMDDARVARVAKEEVVAAEAYMLFYRVVDHPVAISLRTMEKALKEKAAEEARLQAEAVKNEKENEEESQIIAIKDDKKTNVALTSTGTKRKREEPVLKSGEEWARAMTCLPESYMPLLRRAEEYLSENLDFKSEYFRLIMDEASSGGKVGAGPSIGVSTDDVQGGVDHYRKALWDLMSKIIPPSTDDGKNLNDFFKNKEAPPDAVDDVTMEDSSSLIIPVVDPNDTLI